MHRYFFPLFALCLVACPGPETNAPVASAPPTAAAPAAKPAKPKLESEKTVLDVALGSPDHTTLVAAVSAAGKADALNSPGGIYTVFAPTDAAFDALPPGTVESLLKPENIEQLKAVVQHHAAVPILTTANMKDGQVMSMADGTKVTLHVAADGTVMVDDARVVGSVNAVNGVVHVVDKVLLPPAT